MVSRDHSPARVASPAPSYAAAAASAARVPLPPSPTTPGSRSAVASPTPSHSPSLLLPRHSPSLPGRSPNIRSPAARSPSRPAPSPRAHSPLADKTPRRPAYYRNDTSLTAKAEAPDSFHEGSTIFVNQPVGSLSISPSSRDVCLASRKGLYILDLENLDHAPRFIPQGGTWQIADCQWSPHPATSNLILSTSSQKLLVWDLSANIPLFKSLDAHARAITDINWHARNPHLVATISMDSGIRGWDLRATNRPFMRMAAWGSAGTQVKWNRQHDHILASSHGKEVYIWDDRKGSVPVTVIRAHESKIYGIDWDRQHRHKLVTCSLDKTIKFWTVPELRSLESSSADFYPEIPPPDKPTGTISTNYPVWRARNLPFGHGVLSLPQRGEKTLEMYALGDTIPVETFAGHDDVVKEFVWRTRGGNQQDFEDREFQLVTWSKDRTLRIWPVGREITEKVGYRYGAPINVLLSRRGAANITYTNLHKNEEDDLKALPPPIVNPPSGIAKQRGVARIDGGMTRGGGKATRMDQLDWLSKVVKTKASPDSSALQSRIGSISRDQSRSTSAERGQGGGEWMSLKDEVVLVNKLFPRPKLNFEKIDLHHRKLTITMNGPWATNDRMAFIRIHWSFPANYPYGPDIPTFELEKNPTVTTLTRQKLITTLKEMRAAHRQCLVEACGFLLGVHERVGRRPVAAVESDSDDEEMGIAMLQQGPPLIRTSGATFGPNGELVCFFPKQTVLPRIKAMSRSPSVGRDQSRNPLVKAMSALSRFENPRTRATVRIRPRFRKLEHTIPTVQAGSTLTIHELGSLGQPDLHLAKVYSDSLEANVVHALEAKRLDHAEIWATLAGLLSDPPPPYSRHPPFDREADPRRDREEWERALCRKKVLLDQVFDRLIAAKDLQMLCLVSIAILEYIELEDIPPSPTETVLHSPEQDYFALPRNRSFGTANSGNTPLRQRSLTHTPYDAPGSGPHRGSSWSQILNPSSISLRITPKDRASFDLPFAKTPLGMSFEESPSLPHTHALPTPGLSAHRKGDRDRGDSHRLPKDRPKHPTMAPLPSPSSSFRQGISVSPEQPQSAHPGRPSQTPLRTSTTGVVDRNSWGGVGSQSQKVSFGSASPLRKNFSRATLATPGNAGGPKRKVRTCGVRIEIMLDEDDHKRKRDPPNLLPLHRRAQCEAWKFAYADWLLRMDLLAKRAELLQNAFLEGGQMRILDNAAIGEGRLPTAPQGTPTMSGGGGAGVICRKCVGGVTSCPSCSQRPTRPLCVFCRLPIKGLSASCGLCTHTTHLKCFRQHFPSSPSGFCPACSCKCLENHGVSAPSIAFTPKLSTTPSTTRTTARGGISPVSPRSAGQGSGGSGGRMNYASLASFRTGGTGLSGIREDPVQETGGGSVGAGLNAEEMGGAFRGLNAAQRDDKPGLGITTSGTSTSPAQEAIQTQMAQAQAQMMERQPSAYQQQQGSNQVGFLARARGLTSEPFSLFGGKRDY